MLKNSVSSWSALVRRLTDAVLVACNNLRRYVEQRPMRVVTLVVQLKLVSFVYRNRFQGVTPGFIPSLPALDLLWTILPGGFLCVVTCHLLALLIPILFR